MHGLIMVTWEKFLQERFGTAIVNAYRNEISHLESGLTLMSRVYDDRVLFTGLAAVVNATGKNMDTLLKEFGHYFLTNSLTDRMCSYLLTRVNNARDLLLMMSTAHAQMRRSSQQVMAPIFSYKALSNNPNEILLTYDSNRQLCALLWGAIEGAATRFKESVEIVEQACMRKGARVCVFEVRFTGSVNIQKKLPTNTALQTQYREQHRLADLVLQVLPADRGITLQEILERLKAMPNLLPQQVRPTTLLSAVTHLQAAGLIGSTANNPGDNLTMRRFWRLDI